MNTMLLREALEVSGLTQRELAVRCEVCESHLCRVLAGKARASKRLYRDLLLVLIDAVVDPPSKPWRARIGVAGLTPVQVRVLVALHRSHRIYGHGYPYFITTAKALHRKGLLQPDSNGWGNYLTPTADALIQKWITNGVYDEALA